MKKIFFLASLMLTWAVATVSGQYVTLSGAYSNYTFHAATTYYISGSVACFGTVTFEGGTILKYATNGSITITPGPVGAANISWGGSDYNPVYFTAKDDNTIGATIAGSTGSPIFYLGGNCTGGYGNPMLLLGSVPTVQTITGLRVSYAKCGIYLGGSSARVYDGQFVNCVNGLQIGGGTAWVNNSLFASSGTNCVFLGGATLNAQNVTFANSIGFAGVANQYAQCNIILTNCILAGIGFPITGTFASITGDYIGYYNCPAVPGLGATTTITSSSNPFQAAGASQYYLVSGSNFRDQGTTVIDPTVLAEIQKATTYAPQDGSALDNDGYPDLGYHYPALFYTTLSGIYTNYTFQACATYYISGPVACFGTVTFEGGAILKYASNASMTITPGPVGAASISWGGSACNPVYFTGKDDNSIGAIIAGSTGNPNLNQNGYGTGGYGTPMLLLGSVPSMQTMTGLRMSYARNGIYLGGTSAQIYDAQFLYCINGLQLGGATAWVNNAVFGNSMTNCTFSGNATLNAQNVTFANSMEIAGAPAYQTGCNIVLTNCILAGIGIPTSGAFASVTGDYIGYYNCPTVPGLGATTTITSSSNPFQVFGANLYYLVNGCNFRDQGTTVIDSTLWWEIQNMTTYAPQNGSALDNNGYPDLGFHYPVGCISGNDQTAMTGSGNPGIPVTILLSGNGAGTCNSALTYSIVPGTGPLHGTLGPITRIDHATATVVYTPANNFEGIDGFDFRVTDGVLVSQPAHVTIFVVRGPTLTVQCNPGGPGNLLNWSLDTFVQQLQDQGTAGFSILDFKIYRATNSGGPYTLIGTALPSDRGYLDVNVSPGASYCYLVVFEYQDPNTQNVYPAYGPAPAKAPYSNQACVTTCPPPPKGPLDVAFIIDNTGSMNSSISSMKTAISSILDYIQSSSGGDYRLAIVTPDNDQVDVWLSFSQTNRAVFQAALDSLPQAGGNGWPESTDECLNTVINALPAAGRVDPRGCGATQFNDFTPGFRTNATRIVVLLTDAEPGGFCDSGDNGAQAAIYAAQAGSYCDHINAIQMTAQDSTATAVMQNYETASCGWYSVVPGYTDTQNIELAILSMLYSPGYCSCQ